MKSVSDLYDKDGVKIVGGSGGGTSIPGLTEGLGTNAVDVGDGTNTNEGVNALIVGKGNVEYGKNSMVVGSNNKDFSAYYTKYNGPFTYDKPTRTITFSNPQQYSFMPVGTPPFKLALLIAQAYTKTVRVFEVSDITYDVTYPTTPKTYTFNSDILLVDDREIICVLGFYSEADSSSFITGSANLLFNSSYGALIAGSNNEVRDSNSLTVGQGNILESSQSIVSGSYNTGSLGDSAMLGVNNAVTSVSRSFILGNGCVITADDCSAIGFGNVAGASKMIRVLSHVSDDILHREVYTLAEPILEEYYVTDGFVLVGFKNTLNPFHYIPTNDEASRVTYSGNDLIIPHTYYVNTDSYDYGSSNIDADFLFITSSNTTDVNIDGYFGNIAEGQFTISTGSGSKSAGKKSQSLGRQTLAHGLGVIAKADQQVVIGSYNIAQGSVILKEVEETVTSFPTDKVFIIGNGTSDVARSNAFTVDRQGNVDIPAGASFKVDNTPLTITLSGTTAPPDPTGLAEGTLYIKYV